MPDADDGSKLTTPSESAPDLAAKVARLERRVQRERQAREAAEAIADRRMRELWLANQELDARVAERTEELAEALDRVSTTTRSVDGFVARMSHEMLTPLNGIVGMLELLEDTAHSEVTKSHIDTALSSSARLGRLIRRLLDLVGIRAGVIRSTPEAVTGDELVTRLTEAWQVEALAHQKLLTVAHHLGDDKVEVDTARLEQIAGELLDNSIKYAGPGIVSVEIDCVSPGGDDSGAMLTLEITDQGEGYEVPPDIDIFEALHLLGTDGVKGAGLGLILARGLASELGGSVELSSVAGDGSNALLRLPVSSSEDSPLG